MTTINSYFTFNGNCREAMTFYKDCLGGELTFQTVGESPLAAQMPERMKASILHAMLSSEGFVLMGSDMAPETGLLKGNGLAAMLNCSSEEEIRNTFRSLSSKGIVKHQLETTFWGALFGDLTDKYGNNWILHFEKKSN